MFFSIIIPIYNVEEYLVECITSVLEQTYMDFELILVDDGSPDSCGEICDEYALRDSRIKVIHKENGGLSDARNTGISAAKGKYLVFVDGDDTLADCYVLEKLYQNLQEKAYPDILLEYAESDEKLKACNGEACLLQLLNNHCYNVTVWNKIYKRKMIIENSLYFIKGYVHEDDYWTPITIAHAQVCDFIDFSICYHRLNEASITQNPSEKSITRRVCSKMHLAFQGASYFERYKCDENFRREVYTMYVGMFFTGIIGSFSIKDRNLKKEIRKKKKETAKILLFAPQSKKRSHKILARIYSLFGLWAVTLILKLKTIF